MSMEKRAWEKIEGFLSSDTFNGFTKDDLFILRFVKKGWGQDIAALSNMAEAISVRHEAGLLDSAKSQTLLRSTFERATHSSVSPYRTDISSITDLGAFGYYLEHLNIIAGLSCALGDREYAEVNVRISAHLNEMSLTQDNAHARLLPHVKMRGSADQAAILKSLWLCDQNHGTDFHAKPAEKWLAFMSENMTDPETGLFQTEVMRVKRYSRQPRGCALAYMAHYLQSFAPEVASHQWKLFKRAMLKTRLGLTGFREYLPSYAGKWTPDSGPIVGGVGIAATGLGLKAARTLSDPEAHGILKRSVDRALLGIRLINFVPGAGIITSIGTDLLASAIYSNSLWAGYGDPREQVGADQKDQAHPRRNIMRN